MIHIPILRAGHPYNSLEVVRLSHVKTGEPVAIVSQANPGLIAKDLRELEQSRYTLNDLSVSDLLTICRKAARLFLASELPVGGEVQSPGDYVRQLSGTTGMPESLCWKNMNKIQSVLEEMQTVLAGLTRGLDLSFLNSGWVVQDTRLLSYVSQTNGLGAVLPSNSPGVHSLWLPAIPLKTPLVLKPGSQEPWTPFRIIQAFVEAGCPPEIFGFYPTDYSGTSEILLRCRRSLLFGSGATVAPWKMYPRVQIHGPGRSKIVIMEDSISKWENYLDVMVVSVLENGGRSCINASSVWVPACGREIAVALAKRLVSIDAKPLDNPDAKIAAFTDPKHAHRISSLIDNQLKMPGATDLTSELRGTKRVVEVDGCTFVLPTVIWCEDAGHPLANTELLFPFVSVIEIPQHDILEHIGPSLVVTAITEDKAYISELLSAVEIERLNLGPISTSQISWEQPHEGNLFEFLYRQRALSITGETL